MTLEQLALLGVALFAFMAIVVAYGTIRTIKRAAQSQAGLQRVRRLIGSEESARLVAESVLREIVAKHEAEVEEARREGNLPPPLEEAINEGRAYYLGRVESRHRGLFNLVVSELVFLRTHNNNTEKEQER